MKIGILVDSNNHLTDNFGEVNLLIYETYSGLKSFLNRIRLLSDDDIAQHLLLNKAQCLFARDLTPNLSGLLEEYRITPILFKTRTIEETFQAFFQEKGVDTTIAPENRSMARYQQSVTAMEAASSHDFNDLMYFDDDDIGGS